MKKILILILCALPLFTFSQKKKKLTMEEQVAIAKQQEKEAMAKMQAEKPFAIPGASLPAFDVLTSDEKLLFDTNLVRDLPLILVFFNPSCDHCTKVAKEFVEHKNLFQKTNILFISGDNLWGDLKSFIKETGILPEHEIIVAADHSGIAKHLFTYNGIPQIMVYNKKKVLQKIFYQNLDKDSVLHYLNK